jgi:branched-chain amino acid transport system ATP-binding protein
MHFCLGVADDAVVIDKGAIVYRDTISGLKANEEVRRRYLAM